jgi:hypothetical protein
MATESSVTAYVEKFGVVNSVEVRLLDTNHELDNSKIFGDMREIKDQINASQILLRTQKSGEVGLNKYNVTKLISAQAEDGNAKITLRGKALNGNKLVAMNDSFNVAIPIEPLSSSVLKAANHVYNKIKDQVALGTITLRNGGKAAKKKVADLIASRNL